MSKRLDHLVVVHMPLWLNRWPRWRAFKLAALKRLYP